MPPLSREDFNRIRQIAIESAPDGLTREQFDARLDAMLQATEDASERVPGSDVDALGEQAFSDSLMDTGTRTIRGVVRGAKEAINPINIVRGLYSTGKDVLTNRGAETRAGLSAIASSLAEGDPDVGGEMIGNLLVGGAVGRVPAMARGVPNAMVKTGDAAARVGKATRPISGYGAMGSIMTGHPAALAATAAPYAIEGAGRLTSRVGRSMGGRRGAPAGVRLNTAPAAVPLDDVLLEALEEVRAGSAPSRVGGAGSPLSSKNNLPVVNPERTGGMISTQPDKWGATSIHQADDFVDRSRLVDRARPVQKAALADDAFARNIKGDPQRQQLVRELLRAEAPEDLGGSLTRSGRSMFTPDEASMFENALRELRSGSLNRAQSIGRPLR